MTKANSLDQLLSSLTNSCSRFLRLDDFVIYTRCQEEDTLIQAAAFGEKRGEQDIILNPLQLPIGKGIVGISALTQSPQIVDDTSKNNHYLVDDQKRLSELAVPIIWKDKVIGVIDSEHQHRSFFSANYVDIFCLIANLSAPVLHQFLPKKKKKKGLNNHYYKQLIQLFEEDKIYRNKQLSLTTVAQQLTISPTYLSNIIHQTGDESFSELVNKYRVEELKQRMLKGEHKYYKLLALAYQVGFNSKSSFNYNFKLQTAQTPTEYIRTLVLGKST